MREREREREREEGHKQCSRNEVDVTDLRSPETKEKGELVLILLGCFVVVAVLPVEEEIK